MRILISLLVVGMFASATAAAVLPPPAASPIFDPARFFDGHTQGTGSLKIIAAKRKPVLVEGHGHLQPGGVLVLDQTVREGGKPPATRRWTFRAVDGGRYAGTLSDAAGPVAGDVTGNRLHLHFRMKGGIVADQFLDLAPDGLSAQNRMSFRKLGVVVARLDETIVRRP